MKRNKIVILLTILLITGCTWLIEDPSDIIISIEPSSSVIIVDGSGAVEDFYFTFTLKSNSKQIDLVGIETEYYNDNSTLIASRRETGTFITLIGENDKTEYHLNLITPEIYNEVLSTKNVRTNVIFTFKSISQVEKVMKSTITLVKTEETTSE